MKFLALFVWWFAVVLNGGKEVVYFEYVLERDCRIAQRNYSRVVTASTCLEKFPNQKPLGGIQS